ncbi:MAG: hypothetical protein HY063_11250 [Bacteroidetes bacterium]|nr:hypothetical protein [Bacteroidota bacterium]
METQNQNTEKKSAAKKAGGLLFVGCMFIGMALGWYFDAYQIGMFGGMGVGFIMMAVVILSQSNRK